MGCSPWSKVLARVDDRFGDFTLSTELDVFLHAEREFEIVLIVSCSFHREQIADLRLLESSTILTTPC